MQAGEHMVPRFEGRGSSGSQKGPWLKESIEQNLQRDAKSRSWEVALKCRGHDDHELLDTERERERERIR